MKINIFEKAVEKVRNIRSLNRMKGAIDEEVVRLAMSDKKRTDCIKEYADTMKKYLGIMDPQYYSEKEIEEIGKYMDR